MKQEAMKYETIQVTPLTPTIGAEITGIDLAQPLSDQQFHEIHHAFTQHLVIFFREQKITTEQHKAFGRRFGELHIHPVVQMDGHPEIIEIKADENSTWIAGEVWHSDVTCDKEPPLGSILHITKVPENGGGDTLFSSMYRAYDMLSEPMRAFLDGKTAIHEGAHVYGGRQKRGENREYPVAEHPIVRTHPVSGRKGLFVNRNFTTRISGLNKNESDALLNMLYQHMERDDIKCRFKWRPGSMAFWDNRCVQHQAMWDYFPQTRYGQRVTIKGDKPV
ncbi:MAG: Taurine dioxygenase [Betaproteobacteria bacterium]|nr:Taurine dioxygenase [Betaproteobacteria bacterium]